MPFYNPQERDPKELFPGIHTRTFWGEHVLLSLLEMEPHGDVPPHSHAHEQMGLVLEGEMEMTIGDETRVVKEGEIFVIPGNVEHSVRVGDKRTRVLDIFSPVREEYQY